ncbi:HAD family phosphatase [Candidatus Micrarchaeota archaeon]|nr:HAD family phosphatase [Candidatus Micrarchaeota archaeon]
MAGFLMIKAVLFDFDGVVVDSEPVHHRTFMQFLKPLGISVDEKRWYREFAGTGSRNIFTVLLGEAGITDAKKIEEYVEKRKKAYGGLVEKGEVKAKAGVGEFLKMLRGNGIKTAVVSGGHRENIILALSVLGLGKYFDSIIGSGDYEKRKPYPDAFLEAAKRLGVKPAECLAFEDSVSGFKAAKSAGMKVVLARSPAVEYIDRNEALAVIKDFRNFPLSLLKS